MPVSVVAALRAAGCVFAEDEARLLMSAATSTAELEAMVRQRAEGFPLEHIVGWAEFCGLRIKVVPGVFVPRRRTELLVRTAVKVVRPHETVVDLGCGSGAVGAALLAKRHIVLHSVDIDPVAVECAHRNLSGHPVYEGDLYAPLPPELKQQVAVIVANTPYVPTRAIEFMPAEARLHENLIALDGGEDGLDLMRRVVAEAPQWLTRRGWLLIETSQRQAPLVAEAMTTNGFTAKVIYRDDATVVTGRRQ